MENVIEQFPEEIRDLRAKTEKNYVKEKLKTALFGGFDQASVLRFLSELREQELKAQETYTARISELSRGLEASQEEAGNLKKERSEASSQYESAKAKIEELSHECGAMKQKIENDTVMLTELRQKCAGYESEIEAFRIDYEELQSAKNYKSQYEALKKDYEETAGSRDEYIGLSAGLKEENAALKIRGEKLVHENEQLSSSLLELTSEARKCRLSTDMQLGSFSQEQKFVLESLIQTMEGSLKSLKEMETRGDEFDKAMKDGLLPLKNL